MGDILSFKKLIFKQGLQPILELNTAKNHSENLDLKNIGLQFCFETKIFSPFFCRKKVFRPLVKGHEISIPVLPAIILADL